MMEVYSDATLSAWLAWAHLAVFLLPILIVTAYLERRDWKQAHPEVKTQKRSAWTPKPFAFPMG